MAKNVDPSPSARVIEAVDSAALKNIEEQPAMLSNLAYSNTVMNINLAAQNAVSNQQAMNELGIGVTGAATRMLASNTPAEAIAELKALLQTLAPPTD